MHKWWLLAALLLVVGGITERMAESAPQSSGDKPKTGQATPVQVASVHYGDMGVLLDELGTVTSRHTVTITPRVDGLLQHVLFHEGQVVKAGQVLETLDPRPFQVVVDQWAGQLMHDQALLEDARLDLARYQSLLAKDSIGSQQVDTQKALVKQDEGTVASDKAQLANARLQLEFSRVLAPVTGRVGLRLVDAGNMVHAAQTNGLVLITQTQPIDVVFAIPAGQIGMVLQAGKDLPVEVYDQNDVHKLAAGHLLAIDNQINTTTGTVNLKATFANKDDHLFPNEFVNVHVQVGQHQHVLLAPIAALQTGAKGTYVYVVKPDRTVQLRPVKVLMSNGETALIGSGVSDGDVLVVDGLDRLHDGAKITIIRASDATGADGSQTHQYHGSHRAGVDSKVSP